MSTRSTIGVVHADGTVSSIYCHWDGYLEHNGSKLLNFYHRQDQVEELIALGDLSVLGDDIVKCEAYCRDRGEDKDSTSAVRYKSIAIYKDNLETKEYNYLYANGKWYWAIENAPDPFLSAELTQQQTQYDCN